MKTTEEMKEIAKQFGAKENGCYNIKVISDINLLDKCPRIDEEFFFSSKANAIKFGGWFLREFTNYYTGYSRYELYKNGKEVKFSKAESTNSGKLVFGTFNF